MKALRFFFLSLLTAFAFAASAQTLEIYKNGRVIDSFSAAQVDSVVYKSAAAQPRYYYYAGWTKPSESNLASLAKSVDDITGRTFGGEVNTSNNYSRDNILRNYGIDYVSNNSKTNYYVVIPTTINGHTFKIYDQLYAVATSFIEQTDIEILNHIVYKSAKEFSQIKSIILF